MITFLFLAAAMAVLAAAAVAVPLLRDRQSRVVGGVAAILVVGAAGGLYPLWSTWDWNTPKQGIPASPEVAAMVSKLEKHLEDQPNDLDGWLMLARSYAALERTDDAIVAFDHAHRLGGPKNVDASLGLGEELGIRAGGEVTAQSAALFEEAVAAAPDNPRALFFGGFAAAVRGDRDLARSRWEALKALKPPPEVVQMLDERLAELDGGPAGAAPGAGAGEGTGPGAAAAGPAMSGGPATAGMGPAAAVDPKAIATVNLKIADSLKSRLRADAPLFVFAREPGSRGPPLAAKRLTGAALGTQIQLSPADAMLPNHALTSGQRVTITARVSFSGQPTPATGDLFGELTYDVGHDGVRDLVIDQVAP
jgi:cytochrome c-type biogenesis protein CcmH